MRSPIDFDLEDVFPVLFSCRHSELGVSDRFRRRDGSESGTSPSPGWLWVTQIVGISCTALRSGNRLIKTQRRDADK